MPLLCCRNRSKPANKSSVGSRVSTSKRPNRVADPGAKLVGFISPVSCARQATPAVRPATAKVEHQLVYSRGVREVVDA